jgi:hypothetical protein
MSPSAFIIRITTPLLTLRGIVDFLLNRGIKLKSMNLLCVNDQEGILIIHCSMEKDKIRYTANLLEKMMGVMEVECLEGKVSNLIKG